MARHNVDWVAAQRVQINHNPATGGISLQLATNKNWEPEYEDDYPSGVPESAAELSTGGQALSRRLHAAISGNLSLAAWVRREEGKRGGDGKGLSRLAADLLGLPTIPKREKGKRYGEQSDAWKRHAAELRKLEEYRQGKYTNASGERRERIANLAGAQDRNPYGRPESLAHALQRYELALGVRADWRISEDFQPFTLKHTERQGPGSAAHEMLTSGGRNFLRTFMALFFGEESPENTEAGSHASLDIDHDEHPGHVYSLQIQAREIAPQVAIIAPAAPQPPKPKGRKRKPGGGRKWVL